MCENPSLNYVTYYSKNKTGQEEDRKSTPRWREKLFYQKILIQMIIMHLTLIYKVDLTNLKNLNLGYNLSQ